MTIKGTSWQFGISVGDTAGGRKQLDTQIVDTRPCSTVGNMSGYRCVSDCRSRGREFNLGRVPYFFEIDHRIISIVILLPFAESFKKGCCQLQAKVFAQSTG